LVIVRYNDGNDDGNDDDNDDNNDVNMIITMMVMNNNTSISLICGKLLGFLVIFLYSAIRLWACSYSIYDNDGNDDDNDNGSRYTLPTIFLNLSL
jgi:hypothetical protein